MKPSEIMTATSAELLARYSKLTVDQRRFDELANKTKQEREKIRYELKRERNLQSGWFLLEGREVRIRCQNNDIEIVSTPKYVDINDVKRKA